ncbi:hypothetical protein CRM22_005904 [Opisthorchis felineus]|uniref:RRM domain-containing protein n=1 Tax=Opisthorchis felineus TaxID=147828 RepID=A0A4S2LUV3_OPIFE|nr:hypothetical protein CRM22_005904 [Opisthorchis felineus]
MRKTRVLRIRDLPAKCRENELREVFQRYGCIQTARIYKDGLSRHALLAFVDVKSAVRAANANHRFNGAPLNVEYCDTFDTSGITLKLPDVSVAPAHLDRPCKDQSNKKLLPRTTHETSQPTKPNGQSRRPCLVSKRADERTVTSFHNNDQVLRSVQSSALPLRSSASPRGLKLSNLPPVSKLSDEHLRQGLFTEFRRCGRIQSIVLPGSNSPASLAPSELSGTTRVAIITFRRSEEAESAYQAIRSGEKLLFSTSVVVEHHPGFTGSEECPPKSGTGINVVETLSTSTACVNVPPHPNSRLHPNQDQFQVTQTSKCPTRTLYVAGLTAGPTGPVTSDQLTTAFRKFGDIIDVHLQTSSDSALIQFAEMRGPIRAMNAHSRDPLRLGGRPLHLAYVPSPPSLGLWFSDLPPSLASLNDRALIQCLSRLAPILEITLINRTDPNVRTQPTSTSSTKSPQQLHYAAYIRLASTDYASQLLSELRSGKHFGADASPPPSHPSTPSLPRRPFAVDFASPRQTILVNSLQLNAARSGGSARIRVISAQKSSGSPTSTHSQSAATTTISVPRTDKTTDSASDVRPQRSSGAHTLSRFPAFPVTSDSLSGSHHTVSSRMSSPNSRTTHNAINKSVCHEIATSNPPRTTATSDALFSSGFMQSIDRTRDTSPSSLSTSSSSSSLSSESSSSSVSSSTSSVTSSSSSVSSARSKSHRTPSNASGKRNSGSPRALNSNKITRRGRTSPLSSNQLSRKQDVISPSIPVCVSCESSVASTHSKPGDPPLFSWSAESGSQSLVRRPLSVMTTITTTVVSPARSSATSSCGLSSPGGSCSSAAIAGLSNIIRAPHGDCPTEHGPAADNQLPTSTVLCSTPHPPPVTLLTGSFRASPAVHNSISASSGVSSGGRSFSSTSSNSSTGSSPLTGSHPGSLQTSGLKPITSGASSQPKPSTALTNLSSAVKSEGILSTADLTSRSRPNSQGWSAERKSRLYCTEVSSGLKLHLSTNCPNSRSPANVNVTPNNPLTVSIKLNGSCQDLQTGSLTSPSALSTHSELFGSSEGRRGHESQPLSPVSAPPLNCNSIRGYTPSTDVGCEKPSSDYAAGGLSTHSTDWFGVSSPVYESMYDKIKRRTNKEAEERRQRQLEASAAREKQRRKQRKKEEKQLNKSPALSNVPYTPPGSFGSEHSIKTAFTNSSGKSHRSKAGRSKRDLPASKLHVLRPKESTNGRSKNEANFNGESSEWNSKHYSHLWSQSERFINPKEITCHTSGLSKEPVNHKNKRRRRNLSPLSSSLSSDDGRNSVSPPGTLTRLSLGMRFPVSATYHECVRTKGSPDSKWSMDDDNESLSRLSTSLSCSSSEKSLDRFQYKSTTQQRANSKSNAFVSSKEHHARIITTKSTPTSHMRGPKSRSDRTSLCATKRTAASLRHSSRSSQSTNDARGKSPVSALSVRSRKFMSSVSKVKSSSVTRSKPSKKTLEVSKTKYPLGSKRPHDGMTKFIKVQKKQCLEQRNESKPNSQRLTFSRTKSIYESRPRSPHSYFSDDATVLDSETEDIKCSDSISHTTGASDYNGLKWPQQRHPLACAIHSGTDDSSLPVTRSPSPVACRSPPIRLGNKHSKRDFLGDPISHESAICMDDTKGSTFDAFVDVDRFSTNSKSTPSTEPMEQMELIERDLGMKFSDDEWHSSVSSTSPHPANIDFDMDYCPVDRTEQSSTTYQSTSFSSQMLSPAGKLPSPTPDESDNDSLHIDHGPPAELKKEEQSHRHARNFPLIATKEQETETMSIKRDPAAVLNKFEDTLSSPPCSESKVTVSLGCTENNPTCAVAPKIATGTQLTVDTKRYVKPTDSTVSSEPPTQDLILGIFSQSSTIGDRVPVSQSSVSPSNLDVCQPVDSKTSISTACNNSLVHVTTLNKPDANSKNELPPHPTTEASNVCRSAVTAPVAKKVESKPLLTSCSTVFQTSDHNVGQIDSCSSSGLVPNVSCTELTQSPSKFDHPSEGALPYNASVPSYPAMHATKKTHTYTQEATKGPVSAIPPSLGPPTEVHDITRYVQSVIERVKAERVEETQQAAAAAAQYQSSNLTVSSPNFACAQSARSVSDMSHTAPISGNTTSTTGRRSGNSQRKPLLVTTSTCSSIRSSLSTNVKWSVACNSTATSSTCAPSGVVTSSEQVSCILPASASLTPTDSLPTASELQVPTIPGVNACAPLAVFQPQLMPARVTRHSIQQAQLQASTVAKRSDQTLTESVLSLTSPVSTRRRRRSETKISSNSSTNSDAVTASHLSPTLNNSDKSQFKVAQQPLPSSNATISKQTASSSVTDDDNSKTGIQSNTSVCSSVPSSTTKLQTSVDPYEPNFDDESPPGFDHTQLHHHRSTSPACSSPAANQTSIVVTKKPAMVVIASVATSLPPSSSTTSSSSPMTKANCLVTSSPSAAPTTAQTLGSTIVSSVAGQSDSVDEVIRDVCAGQFDVESYLNSWRSDQHNSVLRPSKGSVSPRVSVAQTLGVTATSPVTTCPVLPAAPKATPTPASLSAKPFPIALATEPVVAAVTIPVSSSTNAGKSFAPGKNGSNNIVNIVNTLLAALQLIPGSQVTVTGPTAAAGVGGIGTGTISATTITLPVNAARQAAANIKAAVLSATNAIPTSVNEFQNSSIKKITPDPPVSEPQVGTMATSSSTVIDTTVVGLPPCSSSPHVSSVHHPAASHSDPQRVSPSTTQPPPPSSFVAPVQGVTGTGRVKRLSGTALKNTPSKTSDALRLEAAVDGGSVESQVTNVLRQLKNLPQECLPPSSRAALAVPSTQHIPPGLPMPSISHNSFGTASHPPSSCISAPIAPPIHTMGNGPSPFVSLPSPTLTNTPMQQQSYGRGLARAPSAPLLPGRSPPLSAPPMTSHSIQTLIDRLGGSVEPSVLMALAQAAVNGGTGLCGGMNDALGRVETESQITNYLRRVTQQMNDTRTCTGIASSKHFGSTNLLEAQAKVPSRQTVPSPNTTLVAPPSQQQRLPLSVVPIGLANLGADATLAAAAAVSRAIGSSDTGTLISPPITQSRPASNQCTPIVTTTTSPTAHPSWPSISHAYPLVWQGRLSLKNAETRVALHYIYGNPNLLHDCMRLLASGGGGQPQHSLVASGGPLRIVQRMRLEPAQLEGVQRKIHQEGASCVCLAIPAGNGAVELMQQTQILNDSFIRYMQEKMAAGIINVGFPDFQQGLYVVHIFPPCEFSHTQLDLAAPDLNRRVIQANQSHLLVVITTV